MMNETVNEMTKCRALEVAYRCEGLSQVADAYSEEAYRDAAVELRRLYAHRETLLGALKLMRERFEDTDGDHGRWEREATDAADAVIAMVEGL